VSLECYAPGGNNIKWRKDGDEVPQNAVMEGGKLTFLNIRLRDRGRYICSWLTPEGSEISKDYVNLAVSKATPVTLRITQSVDVVRIGGTVDLICEIVEGPQNLPLKWKKVGGNLRNNVEQLTNSVLRIRSVTTYDEGPYRCTAYSPDGVVEKDHNLKVRDYRLADDASAINTVTVNVGDTAILKCDSKMPKPVSYMWSKLGTSLPLSPTQSESSLIVPNATLDHAGMYICTVSNSEMTTDYPTILVVKGGIIKFEQNPTSYLALRVPFDGFLSFDIEILFKPKETEGIILYNSLDSTPETDFLSLALRDGVPEFKFNVGSGAAHIMATQPIRIGEWHTVKLQRRRTEGKMWVDGEGPYTGMSKGRHAGLDIAPPLYIGGVPKPVSPSVGVERGFVGCISRLVLNGKEQQLNDKSGAIESFETTQCDECAKSYCQNNGVCQEATNAQGYTCICPRGFSGDRCSRIGESCYPGACHSGVCETTDNGIRCRCPLKKTGLNCERDISIEIPAFSDHSYIAYSPYIKPSSFDIKMEVNSVDGTDGLLMYSAQNRNGTGDFVSLAIKDNRVEFKFDMGSGPVLLKSSKTINGGEWIQIKATKDQERASLTVSMDHSSTTLVYSLRKNLDLGTYMYIGGIDTSKIRLHPSVGVQSGFRGCISDVSVSGTSLDLVESAKDSANIEDCRAIRGNPCRNEPCRNNGLCAPIGQAAEYKCICRDGFTGRNCETSISECYHNPCQNRGKCRVTESGATACNCPLGFGGQYCENNVDIDNNISVRGNGYVEIENYHLHHSGHDEFSMTVTTTYPYGLIFWNGQRPEEDGRGKDFLAVSVNKGYVELSYELGSGDMTIRSDEKIDDGKPHHIRVSVSGVNASLTIDGNIKHNFGTGASTQLNAEGNIYIGGLPDIQFMTGGKYSQGFTGCVGNVRFMGSPFHFGKESKESVNVTPCAKGNEEEEIDDDDEFNEIVN